MADSSTGGYLSPAPSPAPLVGDGLNTFIQPLIVGITGLPGPMVRRVFQAEPPNIPDAGQAWAAFRITSRPVDAIPHISHEDTPAGGQDRMRRHEMLHVLVSFYDLGSSGLADAYCALLRDGLAHPQNHEVLSKAGMGLASMGEPVDVPVIIKQRWQYRTDLPFAIRREIVRVYPVKNVLTATGSINTGSGSSTPFATR